MSEKTKVIATLIFFALALSALPFGAYFFNSAMAGEKPYSGNAVEVSFDNTETWHTFNTASNSSLTPHAVGDGYGFSVYVKSSDPTWFLSPTASYSCGGKELTTILTSEAVFSLSPHKVKEITYKLPSGEAETLCKNGGDLTFNLTT